MCGTLPLVVAWMSLCYALTTVLANQGLISLICEFVLAALLCYSCCSLSHLFNILTALWCASNVKQATIRESFSCDIYITNMPDVAGYAINWRTLFFSLRVCTYFHRGSRGIYFTQEKDKCPYHQLKFFSQRASSLHTIKQFSKKLLKEHSCKTSSSFHR